MAARLHLRDRDGQKLAYVYFEEEPGAAISGQAAHPRRGATHCRQRGEAAGATAEPLDVRQSQITSTNLKGRIAMALLGPACLVSMGSGRIPRIILMPSLSTFLNAYDLPN